MLRPLMLTRSGRCGWRSRRRTGPGRRRRCRPRWSPGSRSTPGSDDGLPGRVQRGAAARLAGDQVERPRGGRPELGVVEVVAHRVVLGVVPQPGHGVAVVVVHDQAGRLVVGGRAGADPGLLHELVHQPAVHGLLLGGVAVVLVTGQGLRRGQPLGVGRVGVVGQQRRGQAVHARRPRLGVEGVPVGVGRVRVGGEVVIEADVLLEDHHDMLDGGGGASRRGRAAGRKRRRRAPRWRPSRRPGKARRRRRRRALSGKTGASGTSTLVAVTLGAMATLTMAGQASVWVNGKRRRG